MNSTKLMTIAELPKPPEGKTGWPWTEQSEPLGDRTPDGSEWPRISIVTPSYNQGEFIEETIRSILLQGYPNLEYIIIDGGSTDSTLEIIKKYEPWITYWESKPDNGPASAINKGIQKCTGEWFNWINSDDLLLPKALFTLAKISKIAPEQNWISGSRLNITKDGLIGCASIPWSNNPSMFLLNKIFLPQDSTFVRLKWLRKESIYLDENLGFIFDAVFHQRLYEIELPLLTTSVFSAMRFHDSQRTANKVERDREVRESGIYRSFIQNLLLRAMRTRYRNSIEALLCFLITLGFSHSIRKLMCCYYDCEINSFVISPMYKNILKGF